MNDLIKRQDAIRTVCECECYSAPCDEGRECYAVGKLRQLPSADRLQGEWITIYPHMLSVEDQKFYGAKNPTEPTPDERFPVVICSLCGCHRPVFEDKFCPNCGAPMKGAKDE